MFGRKTFGARGASDFSGFWIPYSDLMAALLGVFALLLIVTIYKMGEPIKDVQDLLKERRQVVEELRANFAADERIEITEAGSIRLKGEVLFSSNADSLSATGRSILLDIMPQYLSVVTSREKFASQLSRILVEGHADPSFAGVDPLAGYLYNLGLSQRRAASVVAFLMSATELAEYRAFMEAYFMASGRSSTDLVMNMATSTVDSARSRRIQIDFLMKDGELVDELMGEISLQRKLPR